MKMKMILKKRAARSGFSLLEALIGMTVVGVVFVSLYAAMASGFSMTALARENLRATQILTEMGETFRLYTWTQITTPGWVPTQFTATYSPYDETSVTNTSVTMTAKTKGKKTTYTYSTNSTSYSTNVAAAVTGTIYTGTITIAQPSLAANYASDMRQLDIKLDWKTGNISRSRVLTVYAAKNGIQNYVY